MTKFNDTTAFCGQTNIPSKEIKSEFVGSKSEPLVRFTERSSMKKYKLIRFSILPNYYEANNYDLYQETVSDFEQRFKKPKTSDKSLAEVFVLSWFGDIKNYKGNLRWSGNVSEIYGIAIDIDNNKQDYLPLDNALAFLSDIYYIAYTTSNHTPELNRYRIIILFENPIHKSHLKHVYFYFKELLCDGDSKQYPGGGDFIDPGSKAISKPAVMPTCKTEGQREKYICIINDKAQFYDPTNLLADIPIVETKSKGSTKRKAKYSMLDVKHVNLDDCPIDDEIKQLIKTGNADEFGGDRSKLCMKIIAHLVNLRLEDETIASIILDAKNGISDHYYDQANPLHAGCADIARIRPKVKIQLIKLDRNAEKVYLSKKEAEKKLKETVSKWTLNPNCNLAVRASAGIGKTLITLQNVAKIAKTECVEIYASDHSQAKQTKETLLKKCDPELKVTVIRGRTYDDSNEIDGEPPYCQMHHEMKVMEGCGISIYKQVCKTCQHFKACKYINQFRDDTQIRIYNHWHLPLMRMELEWKKPYLAVIDENFYNGMVANQTTSFENIFRLVKDTELAKLIVNSLASNQPLLSNLKKRYGKKVHYVLDDASTDVYPMSPSVNGMMSVSDIEKVINIDYKIQRVLVTLFKQLMAEIEKFPDREQSTAVRYVNQEVVVADRHQLKRFKTKSKSVPVLTIDADCEPEIVKLFLEDIKYIDLPVKRNAYVKQITTTTLARLRFNPRLDRPKKVQERDSIVLKIEDIIENVVQKHGETLVVGYKFLKTGKLKGKSIKPLSFPKNTKFIHFGGLRGSNDYEHCKAAVIIGRQELSVNAVESKAAALWWDCNEQLVLTGKLKKELRPYRSTEGNWGVEVSVCEDSRSQLLMELQRERESLQAIDRLRLIHNKEVKYVYILCNVPLDIEVNELYNFTELAKAKSSIERALLEAPYNVLPIGPSDLTKHYPNLFKDDNKAKFLLNNAGLSNRGIIKDLLDSKSFVEMGGRKLNIILYRDIEKKGGDKKALAPRNMPIGAVKQHLQKLHKTGIEIKQSTFLSIFDPKYRLTIDPEQELIDICGQHSKAYYNEEYQLWCYEFD